MRAPLYAEKYILAKHESETENRKRECQAIDNLLNNPNKCGSHMCAHIYVCMAQL